MLFRFFSKLYKTSAEGCFLVYVLLLSYQNSYKTQIAKRFYGLADKKCVFGNIEPLIIWWVQNQREIT